MDLSAIINDNESTNAPNPNKAQPAASPQPAQRSDSYQRYIQSQSAPLSRPPSQDFGQAPSIFTSPVAYQGPFQGHPSAPPLHQQSLSGDSRSSPVSHYPGQSPYRHNQSGSISGASYPLPPNQTPQSPAQNHQYPNTFQHRDGHSQPEGPPQYQHYNSYGQPSPVPVTPPIGTSISSYPLLQHQRSQSSHSESTPTSAQSQPSYHSQFPQESPVSAGGFPPGSLAHDQRQKSQPGTPLGPPISIHRQGTGGYPLPTSPYQQRPPSLGAVNQQFLNNRPPSPPSAHPTSLGQPGTPGSYPSQHNSVADYNRSSLSEREQSLSVSPKTTIPNLPRADSTSSQQKQPDREQPVLHSIKTEEAVGERIPPVHHEMTNGNRDSKYQDHASEPPAKRRKRYPEPPIWAQSINIDARKRAKMASSSGPKRQVNGIQAHPVTIKEKSPTPAPAQPSSAVHNEILGAWEQSIQNCLPQDEISKIVADWLFRVVANREDAGELASRGVEVEVEAKFGQIIDKDTNDRIRYPIQSECVLIESNRTIFRSSMTEAQHKTMNEILNEEVGKTHPNYKGATKPRVPILYKHRREQDKFYELPQSAHVTLPSGVRAALNPRHAQKVRVTHDQSTGQVLATIIKARVESLDIYIPRYPLDCRISVNLEMKWDGDMDSFPNGATKSESPDRFKDRLSYTQSYYQIDLTQVKTGEAEKIHELEIEIDTAAVRDHGQRAIRGEPNGYFELCQGFVNNIRLLGRMMPDSSVRL